MGETARLIVHPDFTVGPVNRRLFGTFVEHMGRCVYTGIFEPDHPSADEHGFRGDVAELVQELGTTLIRYPGGNFVSAYRWEDGVGPREDRPTTLDLAWRSIESNQVGTDEFLQWCERLQIEPMMAVNLGTRGVAEAVDLVAYCNAAPGTQMAQLREKHGRVDPYEVKVWCLGNELDGPWQMGHKTAAEYARIAAETARALKRLDPSIELVACGSSSGAMPTFGDWERTVLTEAFDLVEHISAHVYYDPRDVDQASYLASAEDMDRYINGVIATADHVAATRKSDRRIMISFDEWNVWGNGDFEDESELEWRVAPHLAEDNYRVVDAMVVGSLLITLLRHTDRVSMACLAQLVNVIAPIRTEANGPAWRQSTFDPFALTARYARGEVLQVITDSPALSTNKFGEVDQLWATATFAADTGEIAFFMTNRSADSELVVTADLSALATSPALIEHLQVADADLDAINTAAQPNRVRAHPGAALLEDGDLTVTLPPASWHLVRITVQ